MGDSLKKEKVKQWLTTLRKVFHFIATVLMYSICLIMIIVFLVFVVNFIDKQYNLKSGNNKKDLFSAYTIVSPSMVPTINVLDVVVTMRVNSPEEIEKEDIVTFNSTDYRYSGVLVTHRIVDIEKTSSGEYLFTTKGDNNNTKDQNLVDPSDVEGVYVFKIPKLGEILLLLKEPRSLLLVLLIILVIGLIWLQIADRREKEVLKKEDEQYKKEFEEFKKRQIEKSKK